MKMALIDGHFVLLINSKILEISKSKTCDYVFYENKNVQVKEITAVDMSTNGRRLKRISIVFIEFHLLWNQTNLYWPIIFETYFFAHISW